MSADAPAAQRSGRLPEDVTSFVGRRRELAEAKRLLSGFRLLTLTGVGGVGKTRLARRVAAEVRRAFPDGVWFVDLTTVRDPDLLSREVEDPAVLAYLVAAELGLREQARQAPLESLANHLATRSLLLVLDNCERLIPACGRLATALLQECPRLRILATSREPLGISGETAFAVPPLCTPDPDRSPAVAELLLFESIALFTARAEAVDPTFRLTGENHLAVAGICQRLDGVPLAIELAAARLRALTPHQILNLLGDRFTLLTRGSRTGPDRQQTLRACIDWSFELCTKRERLLWSRIAVFVGGCELDAIEGVCTDEELPESDLLDVVAGLIDKSVLTRDESQGEFARYRMLESIREYGLERLSESGDYEATRRRHLAWYQKLVARVRAEWVSDLRGYWLDRLRREQSNLRAAVEFCLRELDEPDEALRLVTALPSLVWWWGEGVFDEGRRWLELALAEASPTALYARALLLGADLALGQGETDTATRLLAEGDQLARRLGDTPTMAFADCVRGSALLFGGEPQAAVDPLARARDALSSAPQPDADLLVLVLLSLGGAAAQAGDRELAGTCRADLLAITRGGPAFQRVMWSLGVTAWVQGDDREAGRCAEAFLRFVRENVINDGFGVASAVEVLAWVAAARRRHARAATLLGAAETLYDDAGTSLAAFPTLIGYHRACEQHARDALGPGAFDEYVHKGRTASYEDAITYALGDQPAAQAAATEASSAGLTRREHEVAELVAQGHSNKEIATALVISERTAETHVQHILIKLSFTSRTQVVNWIATQRAEEQAR